MSAGIAIALGDYAEDYATVNVIFNIPRDDTGAPIILAGGPVVSVYKGSNVTPKTSAESYITLDLDYASVVGLCHILIDLSGDAFFATGEDYSVVLTTGTVNSIVKVSTVLAFFSIENRSSVESTSIASILAGVITNAAGADVAADIIALKVTADAIEAGTITNAAGADVAADIIAIKAQTVAIEVDTGEIGTAGASLSDLGGMSTAMKAEVNVEAKDVLATDTFSELAQGTPSATPTIVSALQLIYKMARNKSWLTSTSYTLFNDAGATVDQKATVSDDGTTFKREEVESGP